jgi:hypothetical protein
MSVLPASRLSPSDLALLGNNLRPGARRLRSPECRGRREDRRELAAVNRSLAAIGERFPRPTSPWPC